MNLRKRMLRALFFPVTVFLWLVGWCLYIVGSKNNQNRAGKSQAASKKDPIETIVMINEEMLIATDES